MNDAIGLVAATLVGVLLIRWFRLRRRAKVPPLQGAMIPRSITLRPQPLLTKSEAALYNTIQLAVQDHFLVFPQVPLWCLVNVNTPDPNARNALLGKIAFRRVDFALVHPGSLEVAKVVELDHQGPAQGPAHSQNRTRRELVKGVLKAAGIEIITLKAEKAYDLSDLAKLLGVFQEE